MSTSNWTRVDNVFCTENMAEAVMSCETCPRLRGPGTDHVPIHTIVDIYTDHKESAPFRNFRMTNWPEFREKLAENLADIPTPKELKSEEMFNKAVQSLTQVLQDTIEEAVPLSKPMPHSRRWWNADLTRLKKEKNRLNHLSYIYRACADHPSHQEQRDICNKYANAIQEAKTKHWEEYLEELNEDQLWGAGRYISNPTNDGGKARIPTLTIKEPSGTQTIAETNEEKSKLLARAFFPPKPTTASSYDQCSYPDCVPYNVQINLSQLRRQVQKLKAHKAPGPDGIPNVVLKESLELIELHLLHIFRAVFALRTYSSQWKSWTTIILRKPGKPNYGVPKAYRPIALLNTIGKLLAAIVTEDLVYITEKYQLLPPNHFGGRPGRTMTDPMHLMVNKIKNAWRHHKVVVMLFLDIEGAFPNAVNDRLIHNMRKRRIPEEYTLFIE